MPELPEVEIVCQGLTPAITGKTIISLKQNRPDLRVPFPDDFAKKVQGSKITAVKRRAKYIQIILDNQWIMIIHLGMSGVVKIIKPCDIYEKKKHDHLSIDLDDGTIIALNDPRRFGMVLLIKENEINKHKNFKHIGPEPFSNEFNDKYLYDQLKNKTGSIKNSLLDQSIIAGLGNIYVCEVLYQTSISPLRKSNKITKKECENLVPAIIDTLKKAIQAGGSTLKDYKHTDGKLGYFQHQFCVYGKEKEKCPDCTCNEYIIRVNQSGRSSFYCAKKQK